MDATAVQIGAMAVTGFAIAGGVNQVLKLIDRTKPSPPVEETYVTKELYRTATANAEVRLSTVERELSGLREKLDKMSTADEVRASRIHERIDKLEGELGQVPQQVIALLRNSREI